VRDEIDFNLHEDDQTDFYQNEFNKVEVPNSANVMMGSQIDYENCFTMSI
jgi:hypothetical protein